MDKKELKKLVQGYRSLNEEYKNATWEEKVTCTDYECRGKGTVKTDNEFMDLGRCGKCHGTGKIPKKEMLSDKINGLTCELMPLLVTEVEQLWNLYDSEHEE